MTKKSALLALALLAVSALALAAPGADDAADPKGEIPGLRQPPVAAKSAGGPDSAGYRWIDSREAGGPAYSWEEISGTGAALGLTDDAETNITIPFDFKFYGVSSASLRVGNNGGVIFNAASGDISANNVALPNATWPAAILAFWDDVDSDLGDVYWQVLGSAPDRRLVIEWYNRPRYSNIGSCTFEMILEETSNRILFQYADLNFENASYDYGISATVGIQGSSAAAEVKYLLYSYNTASLQDSLAILFYPYQPDHDLALSDIDAPASFYVPAGQAFTPTVTISNRGKHKESGFHVFYQINDSLGGQLYLDSAAVLSPDSLWSDSSRQLTFAGFTPEAETRYTAVAWTGLADEVPGNDTLQFAFRTYDRDIGTTAINAPASVFISPDSTITPRATFHNYGLEASSFSASFRIDSAGVAVYSQTVAVDSLAPGADTVVVFSDWAAPHPLFNYRAWAYAYIKLDSDHSNDTLQFAFRTYDRDIGTTAINAPASVFISPDSTVTPRVTFHNYGLEVSSFSASFRIDSAGVAVYSQTVAVDSLAPGADTVVAFSDWAAPHPLFSYRAWAWSQIALDIDPANDTLQFAFRTFDQDIGTVINNPLAGYIHPDSTVTPRAAFHNYGLEACSFSASFRIDSAGVAVYSQTVAVDSLAPGADTVVAFSDWAAPHPQFSYLAWAYAHGHLDTDPSNDTASLAFTTTPVWYYVANVPDSGGLYTRWSYAGTCVSQNLLWMIGGRRDASWAVINNVGTYDVQTNTWDHTKPVLNQGRVYLTAAGNGDYVFALGGRDPAGSIAYANIERLESPSGAAWAAMTPMPAGRVFGTAVADSQYLYYIGGNSDAAGTVPTTTMWRYDIAGDTAGGAPWNTALAQLPAAMSQMDAALMDGRIYIPGDGTYTTTYIYDIAGDYWDSLNNGGMAASTMYQALAINGKIWRIGGILGASASTNLVYELDTLTRTWSDAAKPMLQARISFGCGLIYSGSKHLVVSAGGVAWPGFTPTMTTEAIDVSWMCTGVEGKPQETVLPARFALFGNSPNPFAGSTRINFQLSRAGQVRLEIYNIAGQRVRTLVNGLMDAGYHSLTWNGINDRGQKVSNGVYMYRMSSGGNTATRKMMILK